LKMRVEEIKVHIHVTIQGLACRRVGNLGLQAVFDKAATTLEFVSDDNLHTGIELSFAAEVCAQGWGDLSCESDTGSGNRGESHDDIAVVIERAGEERRRSTGESCEEEFASAEEQRFDAAG
jgi:hypothetical protein